MISTGSIQRPSTGAIRRTGASATLLPGFVGTTLPPWLSGRLRSGLAGVCLFGENVVSRTQLRHLTDEIRAANPDAIIAIDEEGGDVTRLYNDTGSPYPGNAVLGRIDDVEYTESVARSVGWELRRAGCNLDFAPDVDINSNPDNPVIGVRSFGGDTALVSKHAVAWVRGLESSGIAASAKHFPGHGSTSQDSHLTLPVVDLPLDGLAARELAPFRAAIDAGSRTVMTSHILLPQVDPTFPATFSARILQELLRRKLGFDGVIVTDALDMAGASGTGGIAQAAVLALAAGCDLLCIGTGNTDEQLSEIEQAIARAIRDGQLDEHRLADAANRTRALGRSLRLAADTIPLRKEGTADGEPEFDLARTAASFDVQPRVSVSVERQIVSLETVANIAVGRSPWGPAAAGASVARFTEHTRDAVLPRPQVVVVGKDNHRHTWVREVIDELRTAHPSTIVIDMGWPGNDRRYADVATFGASRHVGQALLQWLDREAQRGLSQARMDVL